MWWRSSAVKSRSVLPHTIVRNASMAVCTWNTPNGWKHGKSRTQSWNDHCWRMTRFANFSKKSEGRGAVCHDRAIESKGLYQRAVCPDSHGKKTALSKARWQIPYEYLQREWFSSLLDVQVVIAEWRLHYNTQRPHSSVDSQTPMDFAAQIQPAHSLIPVGHKN